MSLIVETGAGLPNAESYISTADADTYHANRGNAAWALLDTAGKEQALRSATDYMRQNYRLRWAGMRATTTQALDWPRWWVPVIDAPGAFSGSLLFLPVNVVPPEVSNACAELALRASSAPLSPDIGPQVTREQVGPISVDYLPGGRQALHFGAVDALLAPWLKGRGSVLVVRV